MFVVGYQENFDSKSRKMDAVAVQPKSHQLLQQIILKQNIPQRLSRVE